MAHMPSFLWGSGPKSLRFRPIIVALPWRIPARHLIVSLHSFA